MLINREMKKGSLLVEVELCRVMLKKIEKRRRKVSVFLGGSKKRRREEGLLVGILVLYVGANCTSVWYISHVDGESCN